MSVFWGATRHGHVATALYAAAMLLASSAVLAQQAPKSAPGPFAAFAAPSHSSATPRPFAAFSVSATALRDSVVRLVRAQIGRPYRFGGHSPRGGFDCSGLVQYVLAALDLEMPRTARRQAAMGLAVTRDTNRLLPGDLLTFAKPEHGVSHIAIYIGHGRYVHASRTAGKVIESRIDRTSSPLIAMWRGARRVLLPADSSAVATLLP